MELTREQLSALADAVAAKLAGGGTSVGQAPSPVFRSPYKNGAGAYAAGPATVAPTVSSARSPAGVTYATLDEAVVAAKAAQPKWSALPMEQRKNILLKMREVLRAHVDELSRLAVEETGLGRVEDKRNKNLLVINKTPGPEYLEPTAFTGDEGTRGYAPYGIIGSITDH